MMNNYANHRTNIAGFTLLELSIVLVVIALLTGFSVMLGVAQVNAARSAQTYEKMNAIEQALLTYRRANNRLPCPAVMTLPLSNSNFGVADTDNDCDGVTLLSGGSNRGRWGAVPVITLGLPADFAFDGWGSLFQYSVDWGITATNAFTTYPISNTTIGDLQVNDASGTSITTKAIYVLMSYGQNGIGGYSAQGTTTSFGPTNTDEIENCNCGWTGTTNNIWVQKQPTGDSLGAVLGNYFDDIVHYKVRSQLPNYDE